MGVRADDCSPMHGLFTEDGRPYPSSDLPLARAALFGKMVLDARWRIRRPVGSSVTAMGDAMPIRDAPGRQTGAILIISPDQLVTLALARMRPRPKPSATTPVLPARYAPLFVDPLQLLLRLSLIAKSGFRSSCGAAGWF